MNPPPLPFKASMQLFAAIIAVCLLTSCYKQEMRENEISKIELATGNCFGLCQRTAVSIDSSLEYRYYGGFVPSRTNRPEDKFRLEGYYKGHISKGFWDTLNIKMERIAYKQLDSVYENSLDVQSLEVIIHHQGKTKHIRARAVNLPAGMAEALYWIADSYRTVKPKVTKDTIKFETIQQYPIPEPQLPTDYKKRHRTSHND